MELQSVLYRHIGSITAKEESVFLPQVSLVGQRRLTLVIDIGDAVAHNLRQGLAHLLPAYMHTHAVGLHHGSRSVTVYHKSGQRVALTVHQSVGVVALVVGYPYPYSHIKSRLQARTPEVAVYLYVFEREHPHGNGTYLVVAHSNKVTTGSDDSYGLSLLYAFIGMVYGTREYPGMEPFERLLFSPFQKYLFIHIMIDVFRMYTDGYLTDYSATSGSLSSTGSIPLHASGSTSLLAAGSTSLLAAGSTSS